MAVVWYRQIDILQKPFDSGADQLERAMFKFNIMLVKGPSNTELEEIASILVTKGVGRLEVIGALQPNIFLTGGAHLPNGDGPYLNMVESGGTSAEHTHNAFHLTVPKPAYERQSIQITTRARKPSNARAMVFAAYDALVMFRNTNVTIPT